MTTPGAPELPDDRGGEEGFGAWGTPPPSQVPPGPPPDAGPSQPPPGPPPDAGPQYSGPQYSGPQYSGPQYSGSQYSGSQYSGSQGIGAPPGGQPPPYMAAPPYAAMPPPAERVRMAWQARPETDYIFNYWTALGWTVLTLGIYGYYVFYQLVRRMRDHNARRLELLDATLSFAWEVAGQRGLQEELSPSFQRASAHLAVLRKMTGDFRDPVIWLVLSIFINGIAHLIAFILLDQDLVRHDQAEVGVQYELATIFGRLGSPVPYPDPGRVKGPHNYVGRVVAFIFTLGIYAFWWFYNMMVEPNRHFHVNWWEEDAIAAAVQALQ